MNTFVLLFPLFLLLSIQPSFGEGSARMFSSVIYIGSSYTYRWRILNAEDASGRSYKVTATIEFVCTTGNPTFLIKVEHL